LWDARKWFFLQFNRMQYNKNCIIQEWKFVCNVHKMIINTQNVNKNTDNYIIKTFSKSKS